MKVKCIAVRQFERLGADLYEYSFDGGNEYKITLSIVSGMGGLYTVGQMYTLSVQ